MRLQLLARYVRRPCGRPAKLWTAIGMYPPAVREHLALARPLMTTASAFCANQ
ncbi:hypothetical protein QC334_05405 [Streptomyces sp. DH18]|uniref:hypothetical protein n=1 Tax=unclassified Streptomyces TaxID=2593676 RepID=UPI001E6121B2|nr:MULTISPECIES: hypothetical protein [unclassified Streptomyces]MDG9682185.1 hypothetical protein [Streptomyces sp. DH18]